jgi:hypothetical protein
MSDYDKPPNHFEITAIISICALLFIAALRDLGHLWAVPAMTLFSLGGLGFLGFLFATLSESERSCTLAVPSGHAGRGGPAVTRVCPKDLPVVAPQQR